MTGADGHVYLGMDVGGTSVKYGLVDAAGSLIWSARAPTPADRPLPLEAIRAVAMAALDRAAAARHVVLGVGIASPGRVDPGTGVVLVASNLDWKDMLLGPALQAGLGLPVQVINDTNAAALGEFRDLPADAGAGALMCISIGTGVGAGLILGGKLYSGPHLSAGELGHVVADPRGRLCVCGGRGCLETIAAGPGIVRAFLEAAGHEAGGGVMAEGVSLQDVAAAAVAGRPAAVSALSAAATALGVQIANCLSLLDISDFVIGGGVANIEWPLVASVRRAASGFMAPAKANRLHVRKSRMIDRAAILGAVMFLRENAYV